ncbi:putative leucine-rich repeat-containing, plant-type, leucine-rich repeat domain superfamily [Helianthus annuus]|nr:putative leucine-rich repeat-containing, plant-type, leucine-rich repeat domain superfamily [Helianthus annuus]
MAKTVQVFILILVLHVLESALANKLSSLSLADECSLLFQFKQNMTIIKSSSYDPRAYPKVASWNLNGSDGAGNCCLWDGVECRFGHVIGLDLSSSFLYGTISSNNSLFDLIHLRTLNLADNNFCSSQIPSRIGRLLQLETLNLSDSVFSGEIPKQFSQLRNLVSLDLSRNWDASKLQSSDFQNLVQNKSETLRELFLSEVNIDSELPASIGNLTHLNILDISWCAITETLPASIGNMAQLTFLSLSYNKFTGSLPSSIGNLTQLRELHLRANGMIGQIPSSFTNLTQLTALDLSEDKFTGSLPSLESFSNLTYLSLYENNFDRWKLPDWFGKLNKITYLDLGDVNLYGEIPSSFFNLTQVERLYLDGNQLKGELSLSQNLLMGFEQHSPVASWVNLRSLDLSYNMLHGSIPVPPPTTEYFWVSNNRLTGEIPPSICDLMSLQSLDLSFNNITGSIPPCLKKSIEIFLVSNNRLTGEIPPSICDLLSLRSLGLSFNNITGSIPPCLKKSIEYFSVSNNRLTGEIPPSICDLLSLYWLDLSFNNITGLIPPCLKKLSNSLVVLNLRRNTFQGTIPNLFTNESQHQIIDLSENKLEGKVPRSLENCVTLQILDLGYNLIEDMFPFWLGALSELQVLILRFNKFHGTIKIPSKIKVNFPQLHIIDLSHNSFCGELPHRYFQEWSAMKKTKANDMLRDENFSIQMTNKGVKMEYVKIIKFFSAVDFSSNMFRGKIPESIKTLSGIQSLNLSNNQIYGVIPKYIGNLTHLESLDLSSNRLFGMIPQELVQLNFLEFLNVSNNSLTGPIPQGRQFNTFTNTSYMGNQALCGYPLSMKCGDSEGLKPPDVSFKQDTESDFPDGIDWVVILTGVACGLVIGIICGDPLTRRYYKWFIRRFRK